MRPILPHSKNKQSKVEWLKKCFEQNEPTQRIHLILPIMCDFLTENFSLLQTAKKQLVQSPSEPTAFCGFLFSKGILTTIAIKMEGFAFEIVDDRFGDHDPFLLGFFKVYLADLSRIVDL